MKLADYEPYTQLHADYNPNIGRGTYLLMTLSGHVPLEQLEKEQSALLYNYHSVTVVYGRGTTRWAVRKYYANT